MLEPGDNVLCTVERIEKTIVFVKIHENGETDGSIVTSEIAPGRIRNIRDYVVPKKKIVCKVLRILRDGSIELSLRRVSPKERKEVMDQQKQEKSYVSVIKSVLGENAESSISKIKENENIFEFIEESKENPKKLEGIVGKENSEKILEIITSQKQKSAIIKKEISLKSESPNGVEIIKEILGKIEGAEIRYISAGKYSVKIESENMKAANNAFREIVSSMEKEAKKNRAEFSIAEK